jgi:hypothetical protein
MATPRESLLTAEDFARLPDRGVPVELIRGKVISRALSAGTSLPRISGTS